MIGKRIKLVPFEPLHGPWVQKWKEDPDYRFYFRNIPDMLTQAHYGNFPQTLGMNVFMIHTHENDPVGMFTWDNVRVLARTCCIGLLIDKEVKGMGLAKEAFMEGMNYLFSRLGIHKVTAKIAECEKDTVGKALGGGFTDQVLMRDEFFMDGFHNEIWLSVLDSEFGEVYRKYKEAQCSVEQAEEKMVAVQVSPIQMNSVN